MAQQRTPLYELVLQQMVAESYLEGISDFAAQEPLVRQRLALGNNRSEFGTLRNKTRFTDRQVDEFLSRFQIVDQLSDNPNGTSFRDNTGLSATLIKTGATQYTLAIRSTEYRNANQGGDFQRDTSGGAGRDISNVGFAFAQLDSLEKYYVYLKSKPELLPAGATLNVTGYSLGGHLATVFTELHASEIAQTTIFNGAGRGGISTTVSGLKPEYTPSVS